MEGNKQSLITTNEIQMTPERFYAPLGDHLAYSHDQQPVTSVHLMDYWRILFRRRWAALTVLVTVMAFAGIDTWKQTPIYRSSLKLQIDTEQPNILPFKDYNSSVVSYVPIEEFLKTQLEALTSNTLATRVIRQLRLDKNLRFIGTVQPTILGSSLAKVRGIFEPSKREMSLDDGKRPSSQKVGKISPFAATLVRGITVTTVKDSRVVVVNYDATDPALAADILNTLAAEYIQMNLETRYQASASASDFLSRQLLDLKAKVEQAEEELVKFGQQHDIYSLGEKENVILQKLSDLNTALTAVQAERIQKESIWRVVQQSTPGQFPDILRTSEIRTLESNLDQLRQQQAKLRALYKPGWPEFKQITGQLEEAEKQLASERIAAVKRVESEYRTALQREQLLSGALESQKREANVQNRNSIQYSILKREVDASKQLYDGLLQRMKEAGVAAGLKASNIHIVDPAEPPGAPFKPDKAANMAKALAIGLLLGVALAFFLEYLNTYFDRSVKTPDDVDRFIRLPFLGLIPAANSKPSAIGRHLRARTDKQNEGLVRKSQETPQAIELITFSDPQSMISEAYRNLRTSVLLSASADRPPKSLLVTSSQPGEGKTSTALNLAITLAQTGERVLLVDCDMRNPHVHSRLALENTNGVSTFLSGTSSGSCPLIRQCAVPNLFAFTSGCTPPNPAELIVSSRMRRCLEALEQSFDRVIIDSPPLLSVTDARILATMVDGVILVIHGGKTTKEAVERSKRLLLDVRGRILGTVLNNVELQALDSYYYSKYYYNYGYG